MAISYLSALDIDSGITTASSSTLAGATFTSGLAMGSNAITGVSVPAMATDPDKFLCIDGSGDIKYRTGAQVLADIGAGTGGGSVTSVGFTHAGLLP